MLCCSGLANVLHLGAQGKDRTRCGAHTPGQADVWDRQVPLISLFHYFSMCTHPFPCFMLPLESSLCKSCAVPEALPYFSQPVLYSTEAPPSASKWPRALFLTSPANSSSGSRPGKKSLDLVWLSAWKVIHCQYILAYFCYRWPFQICHIFKAH